MKQVLFVLMMTGTLFAQQQSWPETSLITAPMITTYEEPQAVVFGGVATIYTSGDKLMEVFGDGGKVVATIHRDGTVEMRDSSKLDEQTRQFWKIFAQSLAKPNCAEVSGGKHDH